jgi:alanine dehydrogenase
MKVGVPKEIKTNENRVSITPGGVKALVEAGHEVMVETMAGFGSGFNDYTYVQAGATLAKCDDVWLQADMIVKVKEPITEEWPRMRKDQVIFTYFHFAADEELTKACMTAGSVCIAYETVQNDNGELPLLTPMSEIAGRMSVQEGAKYLENQYGGKGILLGGVPGVAPANVVIIGGGVVGSNAAKIAAGMGANVIILDNSLHRLRELSEVMPANVTTLFSNRNNILDQLPKADLIIGGVLIPGATAPRLIQRDDLDMMRPGTVIVDVAVDQGGCVATTHPTTHQDPIYVIDNIVHYAVANMPGGVPRTSTLALTNATFPYVLQLANNGWKQACQDSMPLFKGLNIVNGAICYAGVAKAFNMDCCDATIN